MLLIGMSNITGNQYLLPTKKQGEYTASVIIGASVNFLLNFLLISKFKSMGASIATVVAEFFVTSIQLYFVRRDLDLKKIIKLSLNYFFAGILMFIACEIVDYFIVSKIIAILIQIVVGVLVYIIVLILGKDKFLNYLINTVKNIFRQKIKKSS